MVDSSVQKTQVGENAGRFFMALSTEERQLVLDFRAGGPTDQRDISVLAAQAARVNGRLSKGIQSENPLEITPEELRVIEVLRSIPAGRWRDGIIRGIENAGLANRLARERAKKQ